MQAGRSRYNYFYVLTQFVDFTNTIAPQEVSLGKARTFSSATFKIVDAYKTNKADDTALAEVEFWNEGKKLEIDVSGVKVNSE